jgi:pre-mRNA-splicing factor SPF27
MAPLDTSRYRLDPPGPTKRNDFNAWKSALDNAHAQLEHQYLRILNLELLLKYGDKVRHEGGPATAGCVLRLLQVHFSCPGMPGC